MKIEELRFEEKTKNAEKALVGKEKGVKVFKKAVFEVVAFALLVALFFYENGKLIVKEQDFLILIGNIAVMFLLSMLFDSNYRIKGKLVGYSSAKYIAARESLDKLTESITDKDVDLIKNKVEEYVNEKEVKDVKNILYKAAVTKEDYDNRFKFADAKTLKSTLTKKQIIAIKRANKVKRIKLSAESLLSGFTVKDDYGNLGKSGKTLDAEHTVKSAITYVISAVVFAYFAVGLSKDFTVAAFGWYMLKVCFLIFRGVKSYFDAFIEINEKAVMRLNAQQSLLSYFLKSNDL